MSQEKQEKVALIKKIEVLNGKLRKLRIRYATDSEKLRNFNAQEECVTNIHRELLNKNKSLEKQIQNAKVTHKNAIDELNRQMQILEDSDHERLQHYLKKRVYYAQKTEDEQKEITDITTKINNKVQWYKDTMHRKKKELNSAYRTLNKIESEEYLKVSLVLQNSVGSIKADPELSFFDPNFSDDAEEEEEEVKESKKEFNEDQLFDFLQEQFELQALDKELTKKIDVVSLLKQRLKDEIKSIDPNASLDSVAEPKKD